MGNYVPRPAPQAKIKQPTKEELELKRIAYFAQRREGIATNILCSLTHGREPGRSKDDLMEYVDLSVEMADRLREKLYPKPEEKK